MEQRFSAPDGTEMVILPAAEFERLVTLAEDGDDRRSAVNTLGRIESGEGTMPGAVLGAILDDGLHPIAAWRKHRGLSQAELARQAGVSQVWLSRVEAGDGAPSESTLKSLADALHAPIWSLEEAITKPPTSDSRPVRRGARPRYALLTDHLRGAGLAEVRMSFTELEQVIGGPLPPSAHDHGAWWANGGHSHSSAWMSAGYRAKAERGAKRVIFQRVV